MYLFPTYVYLRTALSGGIFFSFAVESMLTMLMAMPCAVMVGIHPGPVQQASSGQSEVKSEEDRERIEHKISVFE